VHPKPPLAFQACGHAATDVTPERLRIIRDRDSLKRLQHTIPRLALRLAGMTVHWPDWRRCRKRLSELPAVSCTRLEELLVRLIRGQSRKRLLQTWQDFPRGVLAIAFREALGRNAPVVTHKAGQIA
jgi:hypothetical protein